VIRNINQEMRDNDFMLTTSIAYGSFTYRNRIEFPGIEKNPVYGNAYVSAVYDNEEGRPRLEPLQCRIVKENFPISENQLSSTNNAILRLIKPRGNDAKHYYFYWMVDEVRDINAFETMYQDTYELKYAGMLKVAKAFAPLNRHH
jgi:hypothetical protein